MMVSLKAKYKYDMEQDELETYVSKEEDQVIKKLKEALKPCKGVDPVLEKLAAEKKYHMSVVSSSALRRVKASIVKVGQDKYFGDGSIPFILYKVTYTDINRCFLCRNLTP
jgi:beta-phosphoglucomutase-like phosphatase (HAD superfamily)